ncbi:hypothetical protein KUTeg_000960 [Tegillarca granosa]|uniref:Cytochrome P450 n=1 Tax=Tegillarca granosa TaxID=220873 RepID=A0ABQ9FYZ9_TEGGR|nr:hypothetical protein KUTeg_000960 [Tegillarca granosa]
MNSFTPSMSGILKTIFALMMLWAVLKLGIKIYELYKWWKLFNDTPGPKEFNLLHGNLHLSQKENFKTIKLQHEQFDKYVLKFKKYFRVWFGPFKPVLILHHPDTVKLLLKTAEPKSRGIESIYGLVFDWFGEGLLIANGKRWSRSRRLLTPAFNFDVLKHYLHIYNQCTNIMLI